MEFDFNVLQNMILDLKILEINNNDRNIIIEKEKEILNYLKQVL